jgi:hypothetical protein
MNWDVTIYIVIFKILIFYFKEKNIKEFNFNLLLQLLNIIINLLYHELFENKILQIILQTHQSELLI